MPAYGYRTYPDGRWSAYYGANGRASTAENETEAIIAAHRWLNEQKNFVSNRPGSAADE